MGKGSIREGTASASNRWWALAVGGAIIIAGSLCFMGWDMCLSLYTEGSEGTLVSVLGTAFLSTRWSRTASCISVPCHVYLTLAEDASSGVFVNIHTPTASSQTQVRFYAECENEEVQFGDTPCQSPRQPSLAMQVPHDYLKEGRRDVYSAFVGDLTAGANYSLIIEVGGKNLTSLPHWRFRTAPKHGDNVQLVFGGDMGSSSGVSKLMALGVGAQTGAGPAAVVIGGDIAYDNGMPSCWCVWDDWLDRWDEAMVGAQRLVPLVFAVGNHDTGTSAVANTLPPPVVKENLPYFTYFPFHTVEKGVPTIADRMSHHVHRIGHALVLSLDSGYVEGSDSQSKQIAWAAEVMQTDANGSLPAVAVFPTYHVPIYASSLKHYADWEAGPSGAFAPLFDDHGVGIAFENHVHAFKRTVPLRNHKAHPQGTVYLGDGRAGLHGLGVPSDAGLVQRSNEPRLQVDCLAREHIWSIDAGQTEVFAQAVDTSGVVFDSFQQPVGSRRDVLDLATSV